MRLRDFSYDKTEMSDLMFASMRGLSFKSLQGDFAFDVNNDPLKTFGIGQFHGMSQHELAVYATLGYCVLEKYAYVGIHINCMHTNNVRYCVLALLLYCVITFVCPYFSSCVRAFVRSCFRAFVRSCVRAFVRSCVRAFVRSCARAFVRSCVRAFVRSCVRAFVRSCVRAFVRSCIRAFVLSCVCWSMRICVFCL